MGVAAKRSEEKRHQEHVIKTLALKLSSRPMGLFSFGPHSRQSMQKLEQEVTLFSYFQLNQTGIFSLVSRMFIRSFCTAATFLWPLFSGSIVSLGFLWVFTSKGLLLASVWPPGLMLTSPLRAAGLLPLFPRFVKGHMFASTVSVPGTGNQIMPRQHLWSSTVTCLTLGNPEAISPKKHCQGTFSICKNVHIQSSHKNKIKVHSNIIILVRAEYMTWYRIFKGLANQSGGARRKVLPHF